MTDIILERLWTLPARFDCNLLPGVVHTHIRPQTAGGRTTLCVPFKEAGQLDRSRGWGFKGVVTELTTLKSYEIRGADCGLAPCVCDIEAVEIPASDSRSDA